VEYDFVFQVPAYLATSPISPSSLSQMAAGIAALKAASAEIPLGQDDQMTPVVEHGGTVVTVEDGKVVVSGIPPSATVLSSTDEDDRRYYSDSEVPCGSSVGRRRRQNATVATQTHIAASDIDYIDDECYAELYSYLRAAESNNPLEDSSSESAALQSSDLTMANSSLMDVSNSSNLFDTKPYGSIDCSKKSMLTRMAIEDCQFDVELSDDEAGQGTLSAPFLPESSLFGRCASMPTISHRKGFDASTDAWADSQYLSTAMNDYTPTTRYTGTFSAV